MFLQERHRSLLRLEQLLSPGAFRYAKSADESLGRREQKGEDHTNNTSSNVLRLVRPTFEERVTRARACTCGAIYVVLSCLQVFLEYYNAQIHMALSTSMERMDAESFYRHLTLWLAAQCATLLKSALLDQSKWEVRMMIQWRLGFYMSNALYSADTFYHMQSVQGMIAPESLICAEAFMWLQIFMMMVHNIIDNLTGTFTTIYMLMGWSPLVTAYTVLTLPLRAKLTMRLFPRRLGRLHQLSMQTNWDQQFIMARIADNAEQIALFRGGGAELRRFNGLINVWQKNDLKAMFWNQTFEVLTKMKSTALMIPIYYKLLGDVMEGGCSVSAAMTYSSQCFRIQMILMALQNFSLQINRLEQTGGQMLHLMNQGRLQVAKAKDLEKVAKTGGSSDSDLIIHANKDLDSSRPLLELRDVDLWTPGQNRQSLLHSFSFQLSLGESMLIVGETGVGKSVLLRTIHGLWTHGCGTITCCPRDAISCVPQRPFMFYGSLRENLLYPELGEETEDISEEEIVDVLLSVNLKTVLDSNGLDTTGNWHGTLSLGQQQRLGIARLFLKRRVRLVLLDEATSAMDMANERRVYKHLRDNFPNYISVGHRPSVREYHSHITVMKMNPETDGPRANASFMPIDKCSLSEVAAITSTAKLEQGSEEERAWAAKRRMAQEALEMPEPVKGRSMGNLSVASENSTVQLDTSKSAFLAAKSSSDTAANERPLLNLPDLDREWGGFDLMLRAVREVLWPMFTQKDVWQPVSIAMITTYLVSYLNLSLEMLFGYPYAQIIGLLQQRSRPMVWAFFFKVIIWYYPCSIFMGFVSGCSVALLTSVTRGVIKKDLAKRYLDPQTDAYYHLNNGKFLFGNPGTRISTWDSETANLWIMGLVSTISSAVFAAFMASRQLWNMNKAAFVFFMAFISLGTLFFCFAGAQSFKAYKKWVEVLIENHVRMVCVRENAEAVAMLRGCESERRRTFAYLDAAITPGSKYLWWKDAVKFVGDFYFSRVADIGLMIVTAPMVLNGSISFAGQNMMLSVIENGSAQTLRVCESLLMNVEGQVAMERLWELAATTMSIKRGGPGLFGRNRWGGDIVLEEDPGMDAALELESLTLRTPAKASNMPSLTIVQELSLRIGYGDSLLIAGESGIGKSSVLRAVAGLWRHGQGVIRVPDDQRSLFFPQRPYLYVGTLREQLLYPNVERHDVSDERLLEAVRTVGLAHLLLQPGLGERRNVLEAYADVTKEPDRFWFFRLSLGEIQRIAFARMLLKEDVRLVFLDEATSALSTSGEETMYGLIKTHVASYVSVAHRPQLRRFHKRALVLLRGEVDAPTDARVLPMVEYEELLALDAGLSGAGVTGQTATQAA